MTIDDKTGDQKLQYDLNREAAKISTLPSGKINKYEYLTGEEILPYPRRVMEQDKFTYSLSGKALEKQTKAIEEQGIKQIKAVANQNKRLTALTNKDDYKYNYIKILEELVKKRFDEIKC